MTRLTSPLVRLATYMLIGVWSAAGTVLVAVLLYELNGAGVFNGRDSVYWAFVPRWPQLAWAILVSFVGCLGVAWLYLRQQKK